MKFARLRTSNGITPVIVSGDEAYDLSEFLGDITPATMDLLEPAAVAAAGGKLNRISLTDAEFAAPISHTGAVIAIGMNYAAHAAESGAAPPKLPVMFMKTPNTLAAPDDPFVIPLRSVKMDWEVELAMVIKKRAYELDEDDDPLAYVAGFAVADDLSERTFQIEESGGQWSKGKCVPGSTPLGPWLVSPDDVDSSDLRLRSFVNDQPRQDSSTGDMIFDCATIIRHLSQYLALEPGDVVLTGTPEGVALSGRFPYLKPGDVVRLEIEGLGSQTQTMVASGTLGESGTGA